MHKEDTSTRFFVSDDKMAEIVYVFNDNPDSLVKYCFGIHAEYTTTDEEANEMSKLTHELHAPFYVHILADIY